MEQIVRRASLITVRKHHSVYFPEKTKVLLLISCSVLNVKVVRWTVRCISLLSDTMDRVSRQALRNSWRWEKGGAKGELWILFQLWQPQDQRRHFTQLYTDIIRSIQRRIISLFWANFPSRIIKWDLEVKWQKEKKILLPFFITPHQNQRWGGLIQDPQPTSAPFSPPER